MLLWSKIIENSPERGGGTMGVVYPTRGHIAIFKGAQYPLKWHCKNIRIIVYKMSCCWLCVFPFSRTMSMDYTKPLLVPAGTDALGQIGKDAHTYIAESKCLFSSYTLANGTPPPPHSVM